MSSSPLNAIISMYGAIFFAGICMLVNKFFKSGVRDEM